MLATAYQHPQPLTSTMTESSAQENSTEIVFKFLFYDICSVLAIDSCLLPF